MMFNPNINISKKMPKNMMGGKIPQEHDGGVDFFFLSFAGVDVSFVLSCSFFQETAPQAQRKVGASTTAVIFEILRFSHMEG